MNTAKHFVFKHRILITIYLFWLFINIALFLSASTNFDPTDYFIPFQQHRGIDGIKWLDWDDYDLSELFTYCILPIVIFIAYNLIITKQSINKVMEFEEYQEIRKIIAEKAKALMAHEKKNFARIGHDSSNYHEKVVDGRYFWIVTTNTFRQIIDNVLIEATHKFPELFGKKDARMVLQALFNIEVPFLVNNLQQFEEFLKDEHCAYIMEIKDDKIVGDILRIDLFRKIDPNTGGCDFTGGVFHAFKHFTYKDIPLSTHNENAPLVHPSEIYDLLITGFYISDSKTIENANGKVKMISIIIHNGKTYKLVFYHEVNTDVYFLATVTRN